MNARKLRAVPNCPQPDAPPAKPIQYGFVGGHKAERITASPLPHEANIIARVRKHAVTVPQPLCQPAPQQRTTPPPVAVALAGSSLPSGVSCDREHEHTAGRQFIHSSKCGCVDDAQRHYALIARDLIAAGRDGELTDDMRQAYDYEFGGVPEPEPPQIPEF